MKFLVLFFSSTIPSPGPPPPCSTQKSQLDKSPQSRKTHQAPSSPLPYNSHTLGRAWWLPRQRVPIPPEPHIFGWNMMLGQEHSCQDGADLGYELSHP